MNVIIDKPEKGAKCIYHECEKSASTVVCAANGDSVVQRLPACKPHGRKLEEVIPEW